MQDQISIPGFEWYSIHKDGYVINNRTGRKLKPALISKGYLHLKLSNKKASRREYIHRLIAQAFIPNPDNKPFVNHINGVMTDNRIENLEWCTQKENINHAYRIGLCPTSLKANQAAKLSEDQVREIRTLLANGTSKKTISLTYNIHVVSVSNIEKGITWSHI